MTWREARIVEDGEGAIVVQTPYDAAFVEELKAKVRVDERTWDAGDRVWIIGDDHTATVRELCEKYFGKVRVE